MELGCGVGLVGLLLGKYAKTIYLTDINEKALLLSKQNIMRNKSKIKNECEIKIRRLDWKITLFSLNNEYTVNKEFHWNKIEEQVDIFLAADIAYDEAIIDAFFNCLNNLFEIYKDSICIVSLEKRYNFTLRDMDVKATTFEYFRLQLNKYHYYKRRIEINTKKQVIKIYKATIIYKKLVD